MPVARAHRESRGPAHAAGRAGRRAVAVWIGCVLAACGDDAANKPYMPRGRDAASVSFDAWVPPIPDFGFPDAGTLIDGSPPDALAGEPCAADTNKVFELVRSLDVPEASQLAVDLVASRFGVAYVDKSLGCGNALYVAEIEGPSGAPPPEVSAAVEECTMIRHPAITRSGDAWLFAIVDNRLPGLDIWTQAFDPRDSAEKPAYRITESPLEKTELQIAGLGADGAMAAWVESAQDPVDFERSDALKVRSLWTDGQPYSPEVVLAAAPERPADCPPASAGDESAACTKWLDRWSYHELRLARIGESDAALVYRRDQRGGSEIVLQILGVDGTPARDPWILTTEAGADGSGNLATDEEGGAVVYSVAHEGKRDLWLQRLDAGGGPAPSISGNMVLGPTTPMEIVSSPLVAVGASAAKLPSGFAVAYRALPGPNGIDTGIDSPQIRVLFLNRVGDFVSDSSVAFAEPVGGRSSIAAAYDGRVVIAWTDAHEDSSTSLLALRLPCVGGP